MNCFRNPELEAQTSRSLEIDQKLEQWGQESKKELKVVVMGTEGSGKSTVLKQIHLMHDGFSQEQRSLCKPLIRDKIVESMRSQLEDTNMLECLTQDNASERHAEKVLDLPQDELNTDIAPDLQDAIAGLWSDKAVREAFDSFDQYYNKSCDFDASKFYFDSVKRIAAEGYEPSDEDILRLYCPTKGLDQVINQSDYPFQVTEVSDMNPVVRKKWLHHFDDANTLFFVASMSDYCHGSIEGNCINRLDSSWSMFQSVVRSGWFSNMPIILLFTHLDTFKARLLATPLEWVYPTYTGGSDMHAAAKFIADLFTQDLPSVHIQVRHTNALDTYALKWILAGFNDILIPPQPYTSRRKGP